MTPQDFSSRRFRKRHVMQQPSIEFPENRQYQILSRLSIGLLLAMIAMPVCLYFDLYVGINLDYYAVPGDLRTILSSAESFGHTYGVFLILLTVWFASPENRRKTMSLAYLLLINSLVITVAKNSILRIRPRGGQAAQFDSVWETFRGINPMVTQFDFSRTGFSNLQSYPSGHASMAIILGVGLAVIFPRARYLFLVFAAFACSQRVAYQAHYLSDVCAGVIIALLLFTGFLMTPFGKKQLLGTYCVFPVVDEWPTQTTVHEYQSKAA